MTSEFQLSPNVETLVEYYLPYVKEKSPQNIVRALMEAGVTRRQVVLSMFYRMLSKNKLKDALEFGECLCICNVINEQAR